MCCPLLWPSLFLCNLIFSPISSEPIKVANPKYIWVIDSNKATQIHLTLKPICSNRVCHLPLEMVQARDFSSRDILKMWRALFIFRYGASGAEAIAVKIPRGRRSGSWELQWHCDTAHWVALAGILLGVGRGDRVPGLGGLDTTEKDSGHARLSQWFGDHWWASAWDQRWEFKKKLWMGITRRGRSILLLEHIYQAGFAGDVLVVANISVSIPHTGPGWLTSFSISRRRRRAPTHPWQFAAHHDQAPASNNIKDYSQYSHQQFHPFRLWFKSPPFILVPIHKFLKGKQGLRRENVLSEVTHSVTHIVTNETKWFRPPVYPHQKKTAGILFSYHSSVQKDISTNTSTVSSPLTDSSPVPFHRAALWNPVILYWLCCTWKTITLIFIVTNSLN